MDPAWDPGSFWKTFWQELALAGTEDNAGIGRHFAAGGGSALEDTVGLNALVQIALHAHGVTRTSMFEHVMYTGRRYCQFLRRGGMSMDR